MKLKLILVSKDGERRDWEENGEESVRNLKRKVQAALFTEEIDHLRLLCGGRELYEEGKLLRDALHGVAEPIALHVVAVKSVKPNKSSGGIFGSSKTGSDASTTSLCSQLCIIQ